MNTTEQKNLQTLFEESFDDYVMTRKERSALNNKIKSLVLSENEKSIVRSKLFDLARDKIDSSNFHTILAWIEEVSKLLIRNHEESSSTQSGVYFSPGDDCKNAICSFIKSATQELRICVFTISDDDIGREITTAHKRGVKIRIITDDEKQYDRGSDIYRFREKGIEVHCDNSSAHMHHKFAVADNKSVLTGSYNWTRSAATSNQENILITSNHSAIQSYKREFDNLWKQFS